MRLNLSTICEKVWGQKFALHYIEILQYLKTGPYFSRLLQRQNHLFIWSISFSHNILIPQRQLKKSRRKVQQIKTTQGRPQVVTTPVEILEASLGGMIVTEEANLLILAPRPVVQTLPKPSLCWTTVTTFVNDVENYEIGVTNALILRQKTSCDEKYLYVNDW